MNNFQHHLVNYQTSDYKTITSIILKYKNIRSIAKQSFINYNKKMKTEQIADSYQRTGTRTLHINATNMDDAINVALDIAGNYLYDEQEIYDYKMDDPETYPPFPQSYKTDNNEPKQHFLGGFEIDVTRVGWGPYGQSETDYDYFITGGRQNKKPYFHSHGESTDIPILKIPLYLDEQINNKIEFNRANLIEYFTSTYDCGTNNTELSHLINSTIKTTSKIEPNDIYEGILIRRPNNNQAQGTFVILLISENNSNIILNDSSTELIKDNPYLDKIITEYTRELLEKKITKKTNNKKTSKI